MGAPSLVQDVLSGLTAGVNIGATVYQAFGNQPQMPQGPFKVQRKGIPLMQGPYKVERKKKEGG
jgi:hypothetical protein